MGAVFLIQLICPVGEQVREILVFLLAVSMALLPVQAVSNEQKSEVIHTEFGDLEVETTTVIRNTLSRSSSVSVNRTKTIKNSGKVIAEVTLSVTYGKRN